MKVSFNPVAKREFGETVGWYAEQAGRARATDFRNEIEHVLRLLVQHPLLGSPATHETHSLVVRRYPYSVIYRIDHEGLRVIAIASHQRRPGYWGGRR